MTKCWVNNFRASNRVLIAQHLYRVHALTKNVVSFKFCYIPKLSHGFDENGKELCTHGHQL